MLRNCSFVQDVLFTALFRVRNRFPKTFYEKILFFRMKGKCKT